MPLTQIKDRLHTTKERYFVAVKTDPLRKLRTQAVMEVQSAKCKTQSGDGLAKRNNLSPANFTNYAL